MASQNMSRVNNAQHCFAGQNCGHICLIFVLKPTQQGAGSNGMVCLSATDQYAYLRNGACCRVAYFVTVAMLIIGASECDAFPISLLLPALFDRDVFCRTGV